MRTRVRTALLLVAALVVAVPSVAQQDRERVSLEVEGAGLWLGRNDVRIPNNETATEFSLVDVIGRAPTGVFRVTAHVTVNERHALRLVVAPLRIDESGMTDRPVSFAGQLFAPGPVEASYQFSSYRLTYRYRFFAGDRWTWRAGFTGFIRDARVALEQSPQLAEDTDVGFVPLLYLQGHTRLGDGWSVEVEMDGLAAPQGRAFDIAATVRRELSRRWSLGFGYRTIEGGANVDDVFNFAWLNFAFVSVRVGF